MASANSTLRLSVDNSQYNQGLRDATKSFQDFTKAIGINIKNFTAMGIAVSVASKAIDAFMSTCSEAIDRSGQLAKEAEGVEMAFNRLNRPELLDNLRNATHNTVSDLELMKNAVKFDNFGLSLEQMGTFLAFAQQQAKDTGQSVDYMVDSIVTGLGRKSLPILDNLGLSAAEIKKEMKDTGDMTTAVANIIQKRMNDAGGYMETASDRAAQANAELENSYLELGKVMQETFGFTGWSDMATGIKTELVGALTFTIETINEAKGAWNSFMQLLGVQDKPEKPAPEPSSYPNGTYFETTDADGNLVNAGRWLNGKRVVNTTGVTVTGSDKSDEKKKKPKTSGTKTIKTEEQLNSEEIKKLTEEYINASDKRRAAIREEIKVLQDRNTYIQQMRDNALGKPGQHGKMEAAQGVSVTGGTNTNPLKDHKNAVIEIVSPLQALQKEYDRLAEAQSKALNPEVWNAYAKRMQEVQGEMDDFKGTVPKSLKETSKAAELAASCIGSIGSAFNSIEDPAANVAGIVMQAIATVAMAYSQALATDWTSKSNIYSFIAAAAASTASMIATIASIHSATGYSEGGEIKGRTFSGDQIPAMLNAGEIVLNRAQAGNLASQLQGVGMSNVNWQIRIKGEDMYLTASTSQQRRGRGRIVTSNRQRN